MSISVMGLVICLILLVWGRAAGSMIVGPMIASNAFGSTAVVTISALGGSSPLIYNVFSGILIGSALLTTGIARDVTDVFRRTWVPWAVTCLILYAVFSAVVMPRLFAGQTTSFELSHDVGFVEVSLAPSSANILQTAYLILFALTFFALVALLVRHQPLETIRKGFLAWSIIIAAGGLVDLAAKMAGLGDVLSPIRTANYVFLTDVEQAGFFRISGCYSEASAFGGSALSALAFTYVYWRETGSRPVFLLSVLLLVLTMLSTSSTAYLGLGVFSVPVFASLLRSGLSGRISSHEVIVLFLLLAAVTLVVAITLYDTRILDPIRNLLQTTLLDKSQSESAQERGYLNERSLHSLVDTWGLGLGYGSSRASSWMVAVLSQLGVIGTLIQAAVVVPFLRPMRRVRPGSADQAVATLHNALRACALVLMTTSIIAGTNANPGLLLFVALAGVLACRFKAPRRSLETAPFRSRSRCSIQFAPDGMSG